ncbi:MAG: peptidylprolyl isomerase [Bacteroidaceae bacterium]|nr:peptidylprolyl isomerase [Bacteroidaceae bacterium]
MRWLNVLFLICGLGVLLPSAFAQDVRRRVRLQTDRGDIVIALFDETPQHRDNFLRLASEGYYDGLLFHRVIEKFMIQAGDPNSKDAVGGQVLGDGGPGYTLPAEICLPKIFHHCGAVAAAREPDEVNPEKRSSGSQFYIVWGRIPHGRTLEKYRKILEDNTGGKMTITPEMKQKYSEIGGTPHLDGYYTVFGEVVEGLDEVVYGMQFVETDDNDRPLGDIRIIKAVIE